MPKLLQLMHDEDASCRTKALLALSCLIRLNPLALEVFRQKRGVSQLVEAANDDDVKVQRFAWDMLQSLASVCGSLYLRQGSSLMMVVVYSLIGHNSWWPMSPVLFIAPSQRIQLGNLLAWGWCP